MKKTRAILFLILAMTLTPLFGQDLITVDELTKSLKDANLVIISAGTDADYSKVHITGAINIPYTSFDKPGKIEGLLVSDNEMAKILSDKGVNENKLIVVYDEFDGRFAGRMYFLLKYLGAKNVKLLDGGMEAWKKGRKPVTRNPTIMNKANFIPTANKKLLATYEEVANAAKANVVLIDTRAPGEYSGKENGSKGHLPGAINIEYKELLDVTGALKPKADIEKIYASKGVTKNKEVILYCNSGVRTGLHYLVLYTILGYQNVKVYDGGYNEWVQVYPDKIQK